MSAGRVERIADAIGSCREGRERAEMLAAIADIVRDYGNGKPREPQPAEVRREIKVLAERARALSAAVQEMSICGHLQMSLEEQARGGSGSTSASCTRVRTPLP